MLFGFLIKKFNIATPGRRGNYIDDEGEETDTTQKAVKATNKESQATKAIEFLGGAENIVDVDACMTRLRVTVKNMDLVGDSAA